jgi:hypothetical protein
MNRGILLILGLIIVILVAIIISNKQYIAAMLGEYVLTRDGGMHEEEININELLRNAYSSWLIAQNQLDIVTRGMDVRSAYEARAILERWHVSTNNFADDDIHRRDNAITLKMRAEFIEKRLFSDKTVDIIIDRIFAITSDEEYNEDYHHDGVINVNTGLIQYGRFARTFAPERIKLLKRIAERNGYDALYIVAAAMRYYAMVPGGQQWSLPARAYELLVNKYGATLEGFASPFNSQMLRFAGAEPLHFCSLFADIDIAFGSLGNFFDVNLVGRVSVINPPYIIDVMDRVVDKCISACVNADDNTVTRMFIVVPNWTDASYYAKLKASPYLECALIHGKKTHFYEDPNNSERSIVATFGQTIFILSNTKTRASYDDISIAVSSRHI